MYSTEIVTISCLEVLHHSSLQFAGNIRNIIRNKTAENLKITKRYSGQKIGKCIVCFYTISYVCQSH